MHRKKTEYYGPFLEQMSRQNIDYQPMVWSSYGRPHSQTLTALRTFSKCIPRRRSLACETEIFNHLHS